MGRKRNTILNVDLNFPELSSHCYLSAIIKAIDRINKERKKRGEGRKEGGRGRRGRREGGERERRA